MDGDGEMQLGEYTVVCVMYDIYWVATVRLLENTANWLIDSLFIWLLQSLLSGPIDNVQVLVVQKLNLYSNKDEEPFLSFPPNSPPLFGIY